MEAKIKLVEHEKPSDLSDIDRIIDLYYYESVGTSNPRFVAGGAGAYCYFGVPECADLWGTPLEGWVDELAERISQIPSLRIDFRIEHQGRAWRVYRDHSEFGTQVSIRRLPVDAPSLGDLQYSNLYVNEILRSQWLNDGGLVLVSGLTGQGKTTTAAGTIRTRLERFGGRAITVEDVIETTLEGRWGTGSCRQILVNYEHKDTKLQGFAGAIRRAYRSMPATRPGMLYIGEVRDAETATEVLKAAANGMLVVTTIHSFDTSSALLRLATLAEHAMGEAAHLALSQALRVVINQELRLDPGGQGWGRGRYKAKILLSDGSSHGVAYTIRKREYSNLGQIQDMQESKLASRGPVPMPVRELLATLSGAR